LVRVVCQRPLLSRIHSTGNGRTPPCDRQRQARDRPGWRGVWRWL